MSKKLRVKDIQTSVNQVSLYDLEADSLADFYENINQLLIGVSEDAKFSVDNDSESSWLSITSFRDETNAEMARRLRREEKERNTVKVNNAKEKEKELVQLEKLAKKYAFELTKKDPDTFEE
jgi:hypothetical protein